MYTAIRIWVVAAALISPLGLGANSLLAQAGLGAVTPQQSIDYRQIGNDQKEALKVNDFIYQGIGFGNTFLVTTRDGNVIIDTSSPEPAKRHKELLTKVSNGPVKYIILTHGHGDHVGGVNLWKQDGTQIVAQREFVPFRAYQDRLAMFFATNNAAQFNYDEGELQARYRGPQNQITPTISFDRRYDFELGGRKFEVHHTPGETYDHLSVWLPDGKVAFVGDNVYDSFPNIYTLRGCQPRWALDYVNAINLILSWKPEVVLSSHGLPIKGNPEITARLTRYRDAIQYVHDAVVKGMNDGKDVFTLMREVKLPPQLDLGETYGKVSWSVRGIYEGYVGWFDRNPATMYELPPDGANAELVALAGGPGPVAAKAKEIIAAGNTLLGLRLAEAALAREPSHRGALEAKLLALETLEKQTRNGLEQAWLNYGIRGVKKSLDGAAASKSR